MPKLNRTLTICHIIKLFFFHSNSVRGHRQIMMFCWQIMKSSSVSFHWNNFLSFNLADLLAQSHTFYLSLSAGTACPCLKQPLTFVTVYVLITQVTRMHTQTDTVCAFYSMCTVCKHWRTSCACLLLCNCVFLQRWHGVSFTSPLFCALRCR